LLILVQAVFHADLADFIWVAFFDSGNFFTQISQIMLILFALLKRGLFHKRLKEGTKCTKDYDDDSFSLCSKGIFTT
jgi:hypothetical protein